MYSEVKESKMMLMKEGSIYHDDNDDLGYLASLAQ